MVAPKLRKSKQRDRILALLQSQRVHVTANWLYDQLRVDFPTLSLGNVYRNLNILVEQGLINRLGFGSTFDVYEAKREPHYHFVCDSCGTIEDVHTPKELQEEVERWVEQQEGHLISSKTVELHGICRRCRKKGEAAGNDDS
ncbi:MAG: transcriptional repressor [Spirochaetales bacterium]|nr:transcriptional repressor [Spirochaetales bacterium]